MIEYPQWTPIGEIARVCEERRAKEGPLFAVITNVNGKALVDFYRVTPETFVPPSLLRRPG